MTVDPDSIAERQRTVSRNDLNMKDTDSFKDRATVDESIADLL